MMVLYVVVKSEKFLESVKITVKGEGRLPRTGSFWQHNL